MQEGEDKQGVGPEASAPASGFGGACDEGSSCQINRTSPCSYPCAHPVRTPAKRVIHEADIIVTHSLHCSVLKTILAKDEVTDCGIFAERNAIRVTYFICLQLETILYLWKPNFNNYVLWDVS